MRKIILLALAIFIAHSFLAAQKNSVLVFGDIGYISSKVAGQKQSVFNTNLGVGYQFSNNWTFGIAPSFTSYKYNNGGSSDNKSHSIGIGPFARYTKSLSNLFSFYAQGTISYVSGKDETPGNPDNKFSGVDSDLLPGILIHIHKGFAVNLNLGGISYHHSQYKGSGVYYAELSTFDITLGKGANIGVQVNL